MRKMLGACCAAIMLGAMPAQAALFGFDAVIKDDNGGLIAPNFSLLDVTVPDGAVAAGSWFDADPNFGQAGVGFGNLTLRLAFDAAGNVSGGSFRFADMMIGNQFVASTSGGDDWTGRAFLVLRVPPDAACSAGCPMAGAWSRISDDPPSVPEPPPAPLFAAAIATALAAKRILVR